MGTGALVNAGGELLGDGGRYDADKNAFVWKVQFAEAGTYSAAVAQDALSGSIDVQPVATTVTASAEWSDGMHIIGALDFGSETESHAIYLEAGTSYEISLTGEIMQGFVQDSYGKSDFGPTEERSIYELGAFSLHAGSGEDLLAATPHDDVPYTWLTWMENDGSIADLFPIEGAPNAGLPFSQVAATVEVEESGMYTIDIGGLDQLGGIPNVPEEVKDYQLQINAVDAGEPAQSVFHEWAEDGGRVEVEAGEAGVFGWPDYDFVPDEEEIQHNEIVTREFDIFRVTFFADEQNGSELDAGLFTFVGEMHTFLGGPPVDAGMEYSLDFSDRSHASAVAGGTDGGHWFFGSERYWEFLPLDHPNVLLPGHLHAPEENTPEWQQDDMLVFEFGIMPHLSGSGFVLESNYAYEIERTTKQLDVRELDYGFYHDNYEYADIREYINEMKSTEHEDSFPFVWF